MIKNVLEVSQTSDEPIKELLDIAKEAIKNKDKNTLYDVDLCLSDKFIEYIRSGTLENLKTFLYTTLLFTETDNAETLENSEEFKDYFYRWEHFISLCDIASKNYDPKLVERTVKGSKHGLKLLQLLYKSDGKRPAELEKELDIKSSQLSRLINDFEYHNLIFREKFKENKTTIVHLSYIGKTFIEDLNNKKEPAKIEKLLVKPKNEMQKTFGFIPSSFNNPKKLYSY